MFKYCLLALLVVVSITFVAGQGDVCLQYKNCLDCSNATNTHGCGWCSATATCLNGNLDGPGNGHCYGAWQFGSCAHCSNYKDCRSCKVHDNYCTWCNNACIDLGSSANSSCFNAHTCDCSVYSTCNDCTGGSGCRWCPADKSCKASTQQSTCAEPLQESCPCSANTDCFSCKQDYGCAWCDGTQQCVADTGATGCSSTAPCTNYCKQGAGSCSSCSALRGCGWCGNTQTCEDLGALSGNCMLKHSCPDCKAHRYCDSCNDIDGCGWCNQNGVYKCGYLGVDNTCMWVHACPNPQPIQPPAKKGGFSGGSFVGGMFLVIGLAILGGAGYIFYRWKMGKKLSYSELRG